MGQCWQHLGVVSKAAAMIITTLFPVIVLVLYLITSIAHLYKREYGWAMMWFFYSMANVGLLIAQWEAKRQGVGH